MTLSGTGKSYIAFEGTCFPLNQVGVIVSQAVGTSRLDSHVSTIQQQTHPSHWIKQTSRDLHRFRGFPKPSPRALTITVLGLRSCDWNWMGHLHRKIATFCGRFLCGSKPAGSNVRTSQIYSDQTSNALR